MSSWVVELLTCIPIGNVQLFIIAHFTNYNVSQVQAVTGFIMSLLTIHTVINQTVSQVTLCHKSYCVTSRTVSHVTYCHKSHIVTSHILSQVTFFHYREMLVEPERGSMAFWIDLTRDQGLIRDTTHGGCPILMGQKWILNKWIYNFEQWKNYPCDIKEDQQYGPFTGKY